VSAAPTLEKLHRQLARLWTATTHRPGVLSLSEYEYLRAIERLDGAQVSTDDDDHHGQHMQDLAAVLGVKKASVSTAISKLERRGLVNRFPCKLDARAQHLVLTDTARSALAQEAMVYGQLDSWVQEHGLGDALEALAGALDQPAPATQHGS
jgi:DNA-binding MarR family transcriptional regulator